MMVAKGKNRLARALVADLDFLEEALALCHLKRGKNCACNDGRRQAGWFLSTEDKGRAKNHHIPNKPQLPKPRPCTAATSVS